MVYLNYREWLGDAAARQNETLSLLKRTPCLTREVARVRAQIFEPSAKGRVRRGIWCSTRLTTSLIRGQNIIFWTNMAFREPCNRIVHP
jgi:hypothetical protein